MIATKTLAIMSAGLGTRFGSLKQLHPISSKGFAIIDYSINDAILVGFNRIIFIVRKEILNQFKKRYLNTLPNHVSVDFVLQTTDNLPKSYKTTRVKPWGTGHALLMLKDYVKDPFALINADDFYGKEAFQLIYDALFCNQLNINYLVSYQLDKTLSENGYVSRGECYINKQDYLVQLVERTKITKSESGSIFYLDDDKNKIKIPSNKPVSMNFWGFSPDIFSIAETLFKEFLIKNSNNKKVEFYLPSVVDYAIKQDLLQFKLLRSHSQWYGITYKEDHKVISEVIKKLTNDGIYPESLW